MGVLRNGVLIILLIIPYFVSSSFFPNRRVGGSRQVSSRGSSVTGNSFGEKSERKSTEPFRSSHFAAKDDKVSEDADAAIEQTVDEEAVRLRPALELEQSIQGQVAEAFVRDSLINAIRPFTEPPTSDTTTKRLLVRPPSPRPRTLPTIARSRQATKTSEPIREPVSVSRDPRPITDFAPDSRPIIRRIVFPSLAATRVDTDSETKQKDDKFKLPKSIKANVAAEVDNMIKKHDDKMKTKLPASRIEEIDREVHVARQNAEIENEKLKAEIDELRT